MQRCKNENQQVMREDLIHLAILLGLAFLLGTYLIATTVLITQDGVFYIDLAKKFTTNPSKVVEHPRPFGYPLLVFAAHKLVAILSDAQPALKWAYSGQVVALSCRLLALIPLYFMAKLLVGARKSFWAMLILVVLPYPAKFGSDVLRDWPHMLFLATGFWFLVWGAKKGKWWMSCAVGLAAGIGHMIRPECAQLVIYALIWLLGCLFRPKPSMTRPKVVLSLVVLMAAFASCLVTFAVARGRALPPKLKNLISSPSQPGAETIGPCRLKGENLAHFTAGVSVKLAKAAGALVEKASDDLMHFFTPALIVGLYLRLGKAGASRPERWFIPAFIAFNVITLLLLHCQYGYISHRHCLPLIAILILYVPVGMEAIARFLANILFRAEKNSPDFVNKTTLCFAVLTLTGIFVCLPKLLRPVRHDKKAYRTAAEWIRENTEPSAVIGVADKRIAFYAERRSVSAGKKILSQAEYVVITGEADALTEQLRDRARQELALWIEKPKGRKLVIYRMM